ncbi:Wzz/FepE/Etk N-terminal domain-containing protein [Photobacterium iliopiscarium]|uniref:Wzz/FepE/Etk N-terminal domain-containing protein n=1 Tax=Photobacterium iliopiscarium TaxID=56192 RepID=UPI001E56589C|nr:Wzz/FepE/Etk N-terminal domain-containing protein [Photobacterium iliopiscarium]MCD9468901.1 hypothetical protein [Photobacterium iliopiscarium]
MNKNEDRIYLMNILWRGRLIIIIVPILFILLAGFYTSQSSILWASTEKFSISKNQLFLTKTNNLPNDILTNEVSYLFSEKNITEEYNNVLKSNINKINFINSNYADIFEGKIKASDINIEIDKKDKINLIGIVSKDEKIIHDVMSQYIKYSEYVANGNINEKLDKILYEYKEKEILLLKKLTTQAKIKLSIEKKKTEYSLRIAKKAGVIDPIVFGNNANFEFYAGSKALSEKIKILENIKDLSLVIPEIAFVSENIKQLKEITIPDKLNLYKIKSELVQPISQENKKKNKLILIISGIIGLFFSFSFVLIKGKHNE